MKGYDAAYADENLPGQYTYNVTGGVQVPEGSRVYLDNISFTNVFSDSITAKNDELYIETSVNSGQVPPADTTYDWTYAGVPTDRLLSGQYDLRIKGTPQTCQQPPGSTGCTVKSPLPPSMRCPASLLS